MRGFIAIMAILSGVCMALGSVSGIGYFFYQWGVESMAPGLAAWNGFVLWLKMFLGGGVVYLLCFILMAGDQR